MNNFLFSLQQVETIHVDKSSASSSKAALDLLEAIKLATNSGPVNWEEGLVTKVVEILQTHSVSSGIKLYRKF